MAHRARRSLPEWPGLPERRAPAASTAAGAELRAEVSRILLDEFTPSGVLVDDSLRVLQSHGSPGRYLESAPGIAGVDLANMADADLSLAIRAAIRVAKRDDVRVQRKVRASLQGREWDVRLDVIPVKTARDRRRNYLLLFSSAPNDPAAPPPGDARQLEFQQLRRKSDSTRKYRRLNEELEAATEELRAENADLGRRNAQLRAAADELSDLLVSAHIPVLILDKDLRIRRFTSAAERAFDLRLSDAGKPLSFLGLAVDPLELKSEAANALNGLPATALDVRDRRGRWYVLRFQPHRTPERRIDGVTLSLLDFTHKRNDIRKMQSSRDDAEAALDSRKVSLVVLDASMRIIRANNLFYETFKISAAKSHRRTLFKLGRGMWNDSALRERLEALRRDATPFTSLECALDIPARGVRALEISGRAVAAGDGEAKNLLVTIDDVTPRKQAAEAAALRKSETRQRDFVANVSHELMTPITAIKGYSEALVAGALDIPSKRLKFAQIIEKHADRLTQLVEDLLQLSTSEAGHKKSVDTVSLAEQLRKLVLGLGPTARKRGISIRVNVDPALKAAVNRSELNQVLLNLIANAVKYNRSKGRIMIAANVVGKRIIVSVRDTGIGVPKEDLTRIFDRFHRASNARALTERGSGLGLSIVKSILVAHGCRIWAESAKGKGTTFFFTLPKA